MSDLSQYTDRNGVVWQTIFVEGTFSDYWSTSIPAVYGDSTTKFQKSATRAGLLDDIIAYAASHTPGAAPPAPAPAPSTPAAAPPPAAPAPSPALLTLNKIFSQPKASPAPAAAPAPSSPATSPTATSSPTTSLSSAPASSSRSKKWWGGVALIALIGTIIGIRAAGRRGTPEK